MLHQVNCLKKASMIIYIHDYYFFFLNNHVWVLFDVTLRQKETNKSSWFSVLDETLFKYRDRKIFMPFLKEYPSLNNCEAQSTYRFAFPLLYKKIILAIVWNGGKTPKKYILIHFHQKKSCMWDFGRSLWPLP